MPQKRISVRKIREILRLRLENSMSFSDIGASVKLSKSATRRCLLRFEKSGIHWPLPPDLSDDDLEAALYKKVIPKQPCKYLGLPKWEEVHLELKKKGVTRQLLWEEYSDSASESLSYSQFCHQYRKWLKNQKISMHQEHKGGEKLFVDYAGKTVPIHCPLTGQVHKAQVFVAVWGASNFTYAEVTKTQQIGDWIGSHVRALEYFNCAPEVVVPDNLKSGVSRACHYDPDINPWYCDLAEHYGFSVIPARSRRPKDKAKAETGVSIVTRWILAKLRKRKFFSITEANQAIRVLLDQLNDKDFQKIPGCRRSHFKELDAPVARKLPLIRYRYTHVCFARVNIDYHVAVEDRFYSVPYKLRSKRVKVRISENLVEIFHNGNRVSSHPRAAKRWSYSTIPDHMPSHHRKYSEWNRERILNWAATIGSETMVMCREILDKCRHPEQGFRKCLGILRLGKRFGTDRLEMACKRANSYAAFEYRKVKNILEKSLDNQPLPGLRESPSLRHHSNIRGSDFYRTVTNGETNGNKSDPKQTSFTKNAWDD